MVRRTSADNPHTHPVSVLVLVVQVATEDWAPRPFGPPTPFHKSRRL
eukprot:COSAG03_NODE_13512_length_500_cov_0.897756_2_plen_46_part_01